MTTVRISKCSTGYYLFIYFPISDASNSPFTKMEDEDIKEESESKSVSAEEVSSDNDNGNDNENENESIKWVIDAQFKNDQARLNIPDDPNEW